jgi:NADH-quinone oxidoreductase subunit H
MATELVSIFIYPGFMFAVLLGLLYRGVDRKLTARFQNRIGPPIWQAYYDFIKLMSKETIIPKGTSALFMFSPVLAVAALFTLTASLPIFGSVAFPTLDNVILVIYLILLSSVFIAFAGLASNEAFGSIGAIRKITQMIAIEFPFLVVLFTAVYVAGSLSLSEIVSYQLANGLFALSLPLGLFVFFLATLGSVHKKPFDVPDAKQEIVAGLYTEYSGAGLALFELAHALKFYIMISLMIVLFFGGAATIWLFLLKFFIIGILLSLISAVLARLKIDQLFRFFWLLAGPLAIIELARVMLL